MEATKTLAEMMAEVDANCQAKGWREDPATFSEAMALLHEEISEAGSAWRKWGLTDATTELSGWRDPHGGIPKPEGVGSEFADVFIRLLDDCVVWDVDLDAQLRRHHGFLYVVSDRFLENMDALHKIVARASDMWSLGEGDYRQQFAVLLVFLRQLCEKYGIDLEAEYARKMAYNRTRPYRHGNKRR